MTPRHRLPPTRNSAEGFRTVDTPFANKLPELSERFDSRVMKPTLYIGSISLGVSALGWIVIILVALLLPGGHPPLVAYVAAPVVLATIPVSVIGLAAIGVSMRKRDMPSF